MEHTNVDFRVQANDADNKSNDDVIDIVHDKHSIKVPPGKSQKICLHKAGGTGYKHSWPGLIDGIGIVQIHEWKPLPIFEHKCGGPGTVVLEIKVDATTPAGTVQVPIYLTRGEPCCFDAPEHIIDVEVVNAKHAGDRKDVKEFGEKADAGAEHKTDGNATLKRKRNRPVP
jgi:hypothetical protein